MMILKDVHKSFGNNEVLSGITLEVQRGEIITFVGPSGCGKTTLLRIIGGFTPLSSGEVILDGQNINHLPANLRDTRICFQNYALFPHMTVAENVGYGLRIKKWKKDKIQERVGELLELVELEEFSSRMIHQLSGGQQQRVALARALSIEPKVLLLDEPLSNLDANLRITMREEIKKLQRRLNLTTVFVTHDQFEAMAISDRLVILKDGIIHQVGSPIEIYKKPANEFTANFVGHVNFLEGKIDAINIETCATAVLTECGKLEIILRQDDIRVGDEVLLVIRPESMILSLYNGTAKQNTLQGTLKSYTYVGSLAKCFVDVGNREMIIDQYNPSDIERFTENSEVAVEIPPNLHVLKKK